MPLITYIQLSLFGKTSWERFLQMTGWILEPSYPPSQTPKFQCLLREDGETPEWCEGERLMCAGGSWTPSIGQAPEGWREGSEFSSWRILEADVPPTYYLSPVQCSHFLRLAERAGGPPPKEIEHLLLKQGGKYQSSTPFSYSECDVLPRIDTPANSKGVLDGQLTLFPPCWLEQ